MLGRKVLRVHTLPRTEVYDVDAVYDKLIELLNDSLMVDLASPGGPVNGAVFARRRFEVSRDLGQSGHREMLPRALLSPLPGKECYSCQGQ